MLLPRVKGASRKISGFFIAGGTPPGQKRGEKARRLPAQLFRFWQKGRSALLTSFRK
jgi:hypothetical protein